MHFRGYIKIDNYVITYTAPMAAYKTRLGEIRFFIQKTLVQKTEPSLLLIRP